MSANVKKLSRSAVERFAAGTDAMLGREGQALLGGLGEDETAELSLARRLRASASAGLPDPEFVAGLRRDLVLRAAERNHQSTETVQYATLETPIGVLALAFRAGRVLYCNRFESDASFERQLAHRLGARAERAAALPSSIERGVRDHLEGKKRFDAVDLTWLPPFQRRVLEKTAEIPRGEVRPYGWIAREIGSPGATRAVGTALGHNPIPFIIPCHRVVRSDGTLGEYSGGGPAMKVKVLDWEGAPVDELLSAARRGERLRGSRTTKIVCYPSCHAARRIQPENVTPFPSLIAAQSSGYRACKLCRPA